MCMICNAGDPGKAMDAANSFLSNYSAAQNKMNAAIADMLTASKTMPNPTDRKRYDTLHKKMRRIMRDWNNVEHAREEAKETP